MTICGGPHPTFVPSMIEAEGFDIMCRGEGEFAVLELIQALHGEQDYTGIKNLTVKQNGHIYENGIRQLVDVNTLPHLDRELYRDIEYVYRHPRQEATLGRGCPFDCSFCSNHAFAELYRGKGRYVRFRDVTNVIDELDEIKRRYRPTCFFFYDDTFVIKRTYCAEFLEVYKGRINLPFTCTIRADLATEEIIKRLKEAGCYFTYFGVESGDENLRNTLLNKRLSNEVILDCAALLHQYKIPFATFNMVGLPGETLSEVWETVNLNAQVKPNWAWFSLYQTLPETKLADYALEQRYVDHVNVSESDATFHESSIILRNNPSGDKIVRLNNCANLVIKLPLLKTFVDKIALKLPFDGIYKLLYKLLYFFFYYSKLTYRPGLSATLHSALFMESISEN